MNIDEFIDKLISGKISKENIIKYLSICEYYYIDDVQLPELVINRKRREKYFERIRNLYNDEAEEIIIVKTNLFKKFSRIQIELKKMLSSIPELIIDKNGLIHTEFYNSACNFTDLDVKYRLNMLKELRTVYNDIDESYRRIKKKIMSEYYLNMKEDENEVIVRVIDEIVKEKRKENVK